MTKKLDEAKTAYEHMVAVRIRDTNTRRALGGVPNARAKRKGYPAVLLSSRLKLDNATRKFAKIYSQLGWKERQQFEQVSR